MPTFRTGRVAEDKSAIALTWWIRRVHSIIRIAGVSISDSTVFETRDYSDKGGGVGGGVAQEGPSHSMGVPRECCRRLRVGLGGLMKCGALLAITDNPAAKPERRCCIIKEPAPILKTAAGCLNPG